MRRIVLSIALLASLAIGVQPAAAAEVDRTDFRYVRSLVADPGGEPVLVEPDGALFEHSLARLRRSADRRCARPRGGLAAGPGRAEHPTRGGIGTQQRPPGALRGRSPRPRGAAERSGTASRSRSRTGDSSVAQWSSEPTIDTVHSLGSRQPGSTTFAGRTRREARSPSSRQATSATCSSGLPGSAASAAQTRPGLVSGRGSCDAQPGRYRCARTGCARSSPSISDSATFRSTSFESLLRPHVMSVPSRSSASDSRQRFVRLAAARIFRFPGSGSAPDLQSERITATSGSRSTTATTRRYAESRSRRGAVRAPSCSRVGTHPPTPSTTEARARTPPTTTSLAFRRAPSKPSGPCAVGWDPSAKTQPSSHPQTHARSRTRNPGVVTGALALAALALGAVGLLALRKRS